MRQQDYTFVTNNRSDFLALHGREPLPAGVIIIVPSVTPVCQRELFSAALDNAKLLMLSLLKSALSILQFTNVEENPAPLNDLPLIMQRPARRQMPTILTIRTPETHHILKRLAI
jgi:hypothetical protein